MVLRCFKSSSIVIDNKLEGKLFDHAIVRERPCPAPVSPQMKNICSHNLYLTLPNMNRIYLQSGLEEFTSNNFHVN